MLVFFFEKQQCFNRKPHELEHRVLLFIHLAWDTNPCCTNTPIKTCPVPLRGVVNVLQRVKCFPDISGLILNEHFHCQNR